MNFKEILRWLARRSTIVITIMLLGLGVLISYLLTTGFSSHPAQAATGIAAVTAFLAAVSAVANLLQAVEAQRQTELSRRPYVAAYFKGSAKAIVFFVLENLGNSPAIDLTTKFDPPPLDFAGRPLDQVSVFAKPISFFPPQASVNQLVGAGAAILADGKPTQFTVTVSYKGTDGRAYSERFRHDLAWMRQSTVPAKSVEESLEDIASKLADHK